MVDLEERCCRVLQLVGRAWRWKNDWRCLQSSGAAGRVPFGGRRCGAAETLECSYQNLSREKERKKGIL